MSSVCRSPRIARRPEAEEHFEDAGDQQHPPQVDLVTRGEGDDEVERPLEDEEEPDERASTAKVWNGSVNATIPPIDEQHAEHGVEPLPALGDADEHELHHAGGDQVAADEVADRDAPSRSRRRGRGPPR